ncbi:substrate-binding domain-containing protein [Geodermatophilus sp. CPCC 205506]|uniref:substrate-binding domain-containing protein n=1 Tax=Geodermatophilus sp. CPCC 205506 TaxID=2936596 RepID=UPI003F5307A6
MVASPDIAPVILAVAESVDDLRDSNGCIRARVRAEEDPDVLSALVQEGAKPPDVWIPTSSLWVERAAASHLLEPAQHPSIASSPLVLAVSSSLHDALAGADGTLGWDALVSAASGRQVVLDVSQGPTAPATVGLLLALRATADRGPDGRATVTDLLRGLRTDGTATGGAPVGADVAVPVSEQAVWAQHEDDPRPGDARPGLPPEPVAVYPSPAATPFDHPFVDLTAGGTTASDAGRLLAALQAVGGRHRLREAGFRGADGVGGGLTADHGIDGSQPGTVAVPDVATADEAGRVLEVLRRDSRLLAVVDVSGSMAAVVPEAGGSTRIELSMRAAAAGLALFPDSSQIGLWAFSEDVSAISDYREVLPITPLAGTEPNGRELLARALGELEPVTNGGTGLYDTTLAAVRAVRAGWDPGRVNAVVILTDGEDTDDDGIGLDQLLATLRAEQSDGRAVPVMTIAYGAESGIDALAAISQATGGAAYRATSPDEIRQIFLDAVGQRACRPNCVPMTDG